MSIDIAPGVSLDLTEEQTARTYEYWAANPTERSEKKGFFQAVGGFFADLFTNDSKGSSSSASRPSVAAAPSAPVPEGPDPVLIGAGLVGGGALLYLLTS